MACKIAIIGGGSYIWAPKLTADLFLRKGLDGSHLVLVDHIKEAVEDIRKYCELLIKHLGVNWTVEVADLEPALRDADHVCVSVSTGGYDVMQKDYDIPERYGIYHTVADTVGPGGISRTLRNVPVFTDIAQKMERLCPDAWMIHVTNPLSQITRAVRKSSSIKCVGLCHNFPGTLARLAAFCGVEYEDMWAKSLGVNHFTFLVDLRVKGEPVGEDFNLARYVKFEAEQKGPIKTNTTDDEIDAMLGTESLQFYLNFTMYERFGEFPVGGASHVAENFPFYCNSLETLEKYRIRRKGVLPQRQKGKDERKQVILDQIAGKEELPEMKVSHEGFSGIVESLHTGRPYEYVITMANEGQIEDLPNDAMVETWAVVGHGGITPVHSGGIPAPFSSYMRQIVEEQELAVEAALTGDRRKAVQAMWVSPMVQNKGCAEELLDKLMAATKEYLPQFKI